MNFFYFQKPKKHEFSYLFLSLESYQSLTILFMIVEKKQMANQVFSDNVIAFVSRFQVIKMISFFIFGLLPRTETSETSLDS